MLLIDTKLGQLDVLARVEPFGAYPSVPTVEAAVLHELEALRERRMR